MIDCGRLKVIIAEEGPMHVKLTIKEDAPAPGHLARKLVDLAIHKDFLIEELRRARII
jgi:hypothetical protein